MQSMKTLSNRRTTITTLALLSSLLMIVAIAGVSGKISIVDRIGASSVAAKPFKANSDILADAAPVLQRWNPNMVIGSSGRGYILWMDLVDLLTSNYTLRFRPSNTSMTVYDKWQEWDASHNIENLTQSYTRGFVAGAENKNGEFFVLYSNTTLKASPGSIENVDIKIWNGTVNTTIESITANWSLFGDYKSNWLKAPCGQILFDGNGTRHIAWNNGTHIRYKCGDNATITVDSATTIAEFKMLLSSTGVVYIIYSKGSTNLAIDKQLYLTTKQKSGSFSTPVSLFPANAYEDTRPDATFDSNNNLLVTWSGMNNGNGSKAYKILCMNVTENVTRIVSDDLGSLTLGTSVPTPSAYDSEIVYLNGQLNIMYWDSRIYTGISSIYGNIMWQHYSNPSDMSNNVLRTLSETVGYDNNAFGTAKDNEDDIFLVYLSTNHNNPLDTRVRFDKIDYTEPVFTITSPSSLQAGNVSIPVPIFYNITYTLSESDLLPISGLWGSTALTVTSPPSLIVIDSSLLVLGTTVFYVIVTDEIGNTVTYIRTIEFTGVNWQLVLTFVLIVAIGVPVILILLWYVKNKTKIEKRQLELKLGGKKKAPGEEGWSEEESEEEEEKESSADLDLKKDLKKADV